jgi:tetratricopeptide (TPR) repeat protein
MQSTAPTEGPFKLELVEDVPRPVTREPDVSPPLRAANDAVPATPAPAPVAAAAADRFLAMAVREREGGTVDAALWMRALTLANGDTEAAVGPYLRARATMLRLAQERGQAAATARVQRSVVDPGDDESAAPPRRAVPVRRGPPRALWLVFAVIGLVVVATLAWMLLGSSPAEVAAADAAKSKAASVAAAPSVAEKAPVVVNPGLELAARVASLKQAGNWNVMVLHAGEWTRKDPSNAVAWTELAFGYRKLRQLDEAFEAAKKAVALEPRSADARRILADVYAALDRPEEALAEWQKAAALDDTHAESLAEAGRLQLQLARLPDARTSFERALALDPVNTLASCGMTEVARAQGRAKDAEALAKALAAAGIACTELQKPAAPAPAENLVQRKAPSATRR